MQPDCLRDLTANRLDRIERRHWILKDHRDLVSADLPHLSLAELQNILSFKINLSCFYPGWRIRKNPQNRLCNRRFTGSGLSYQSECLALPKLQIYVIDCLHHVLIGIIFHHKIPDAKQFFFCLSTHCVSPLSDSD